jgi:hypothetical protein
VPGDRLSRIDVDAVLRRARARRRPRVIAAVSGGVLAVAAIAAPVVAVSLPHSAAMTAGSAASAPDTSPGGESAPGTRSLTASPAEALQRCGAPLAQPEPAVSGLVATVSPLTATVGERGVPVEVTLTNTGTTRVTGSAAATAAIALSRGDGTVIWHTSGPTPLVAVTVDLAPGASLRLGATLQPVVCTASDETAAATGGALPRDLPDAAPGDYRISAAIAFMPDGGTAAVVTGPTAPLTIRAK